MEWGGKFLEMICKGLNIKQAIMQLEATSSSFSASSNNFKATNKWYQDKKCTRAMM